ncbi:MAG: AI-2E family transporter, partial [Owenweeksia sp.]
MNNGVRQVLRIIFAVALVGFLIYGIWIIRSVIIYVLISAVIALIGKPLVDRLTHKRWKRIQLNRTLAASLTLLLMLGIFAGIMSIFIPSLLREISILSEIDVDSLFNQIENNLSQFERMFHRKSVRTNDTEGMFESALKGVFNFDNLSHTFQSFIGGLGNIMFAIFSILFITFFFMKEEFLFRNIV